VGGSRLFVFAALSLLIGGAACSNGPACDYAHPSCEPGHVCARVDGKKTECTLIDEEDAPLRAPFVDGHAFGCSQGPRSALGRTHSYHNDIFAVDLPSKGADAGIVVAPMDGEAFVFDGCNDGNERTDRADVKNDTRCGLGYGNHVKIWDGTMMILLAHLSKVTIKNGVVHAGQPIGVEGASGAAGFRHVHMSLSRTTRGEDVRKMLSTPGWVGHIPMKFRLTVRERDGGPVVVRGIEELGCSDDPTLRTTYLP
jgi:hypothetical protein